MILFSGKRTGCGPEVFPSVRALSKAGADVVQARQDGVTALIIACRGAWLDHVMPRAIERSSAGSGLAGA